MSQLKLETPVGGSGTVTIEAPATNSNRTLTLPDVSGALVADSFGAIRAFVSFNGTGTPAIIAASNVASITDLGTGAYRINFTAALPSALYIVLGNARNNGAGRVDVDVSNKLTTSFEITTTLSGSNTVVDTTPIDLMVVQ